MVKKIITIMAILFLLIGSVFAQEEAVVLQQEAGLTPESPLYFLDTLGEQAELALTFKQSGKAKLYLQYAQERSAEMDEVEDPVAIDKVQARFEKQIKNAYANNVESSVSENIDDAVKNHVRVLERVRERVPESAQKGIDNAIENSNKVRTQAKVQEKLQSTNKEAKASRSAEESSQSNVEKVLGEFEGVKVKVIDGEEFYYYTIKNSELIAIGDGTPDYTITIKDKALALELFNKYKLGDSVSIEEVNQALDIPLSLKAKVTYELAKNSVN